MDPLVYHILPKVAWDWEPPTQSILRYLNSFEFQELIIGDAQDS